MEREYLWGTNSLADIAETLTQSVQYLETNTSEKNNGHGTALTSEFKHNLSSTLQELSLRITQLSSGGERKTVSGVALQDTRHLVQISRQSLQEASLRLKEDNVDSGLNQALKGCLVALRAAEHVASQQVVAAAKPVFQTLAILEKTTTSERLVLNIKLLGMRLTKFLELGGRLVHDLRGPQRRSKVQMHVYVIQKLLNCLVHSVENAIQRPMNAYDRASRQFFFNIVKQSTEAITKLFTLPVELEDVSEQPIMGRFVRCVDTVLDSIGRMRNNTFSEFEEVQTETEWLISFAMSVAKTFSHSQDEKDIVNGCNHLVNELGNLKEAVGSENLENLELAKAVAKDFAEVTEQSVNSALLRLIVLSLSQLHGPLDRLIHAILSSDKLHPDRLQDDLSDLIESTDNHADRLFHIAHFAMYCTNDASTAQALTNSLHLTQILEKELVPACLKLYFSHDDFGAKIQLRNLRSLWRTEVESIEANILDIVDPTAFCVIVEAEARRVASAVKKDQYSQDRDWLRLSVSQVVRLCQMAVDFAWKEMSSTSSETNRLPDDHPIIRVERSTWEVQAALKMVIANVEDLHVHKVMIRRVQLMVTCTTAMVECLVDANKTEQHQATINTGNGNIGVKVLTSVSRVNISFAKTSPVEDPDHIANPETDMTKHVKTSAAARSLQSKSFKNITMNNTIGLSAGGGGKNFLRHFQSVSINESIMQQKGLEPNIESRKSRKMILKTATNATAVAFEDLNQAASSVELITESENTKELFRKVKLHSDSEGFRSPLKQISNQLTSKQQSLCSS